jgi:glyoxylase-like metal-dependent hydrolase (beta-lactamase superfamily II)
VAFEVVGIAEGIYHLQSGANSGLIVRDGRGILIDTGLDDDAGRRLKKALESLKVTLDAVILTHGHADHFGGTSYLRRNLPPVTVYAPAIEAALIANPSLEGYMLSAGAAPFDQLQGKFTRATGCIVDHELTLGKQTINGIDLDIIGLAGHSPNQIGVQIEDVLFSADAFLPLATLQKYPVPFTTHIGQALGILHQLEAYSGVVFAPGHGLHLTDARETVHANITALETVVNTTEAVICTSPQHEGEITHQVCRALGDPLASAVGYYLARATIQASLVYLYEQGRAAILNDGRMLWTKH